MSKETQSRNFPAHLIRLLRIARIFHDQRRLLLRSELFQTADALFDAGGFVRLAVIVLAEEKVFPRERINRVAKFLVGKELVPVLRDHQEIRPCRLDPSRDAADD